MGELLAINKAAAEFNISSRTLRYWEAAGLFRSVRDPYSGWRMYDGDALRCIRITNILRHLDFSVKDIKEIITERTVESLRRVLNRQLAKLNKAGSDIEARSEAIRGLIAISETEPPITLLSLEGILLPVALERNRHVIKKLQGGFQMENIKSKFDEVKYITLMPARAAAFDFVSREPEDKVYDTVMGWIKENSLAGTARVYLFNVEPYPTESSPEYGMGCCATVPEGVEIPEPLYEMRLPGGLYAVISEYEGDPSYGWRKIQALMDDKDWEWEFDGGRHPGLEEHILDERGGFHIPILFPVKRK
jgi:DNA-binding transcriptional MerR regulator